MVINVVMPKMGESIMEGTIIEWRKKPGDSIEKDEILLEIGTDKVDSEIPSSHGGIITELLAKPNDIIEVGKIIARIETDGDSGVLKIEKPKDETTDKEEPLPEKVEVKEKLRVGYFTSGNELKDPSENLCSSEINNSNFQQSKTYQEL